MISLDDRDLRILTVLQTDGRIAKTALATRVNLSPTACWERLRRLEEAGLILGYEARLAPALLSGATEILVPVELESHTAQDFQRFETGVEAIPEIVECWAVGGGIDYMLRIVTKDIKAYQTLVDGMLDAGLGVRRYITYVVTKPVKRAAVPLDRLTRLPEKSSAR